MITRNFIFLVSAFYGLVAFSIFFREPLLIFIILPFFIYVLLGTFFESSTHVEITRTLSQSRAVQGDKLIITYTINGNGFKGKVIIWDLMAHVTINIYNTSPLSVSKTVYLEKFGKLYFDKIRVKQLDRTGLFEYYFELSAPATVIVYPEMENLRKFNIYPHKTRSLMGDIPSKRIGMGTEFYGIRKYEHGDYPGFINWRATARSDDIMVNEYESERSGDTVIVVNARKLKKSDLDYKKNLDSAVKAAVTVTLALSRTRNRIGLITLTDAVNWLYPGSGKKQLYLIIDALLHLESARISEIPFLYAKRVITRFFPPNSFIILVTFDIDQEIEETLIELAARHYDVLILYPYIDYGTDTLASEILTTQRHVKLKTMRKYARVIEWNIELPLTASIKRGLKL